jgi:hypothetical protein
VADNAASELQRRANGLPAGFVIGIVVIALATMCLACAAVAVLVRTWVF